MADDFSFTLEQTYGVLSESKTGWKLELNSVAWGDRPAKFDIRSWSPDHQKMGKGGKTKTVLYVIAGFLSLFLECAARLGFELPNLKAFAVTGTVLYVLCLAAAYVSFLDYLLTFRKLLKDLK